ncbi:MAG TPA: DUF2267 domain-containing protein [Propylenella sp.]
MTTIPEFDDAVRASDRWLDDLKQRLGWEHSDLVYPALFATLHALRDHLPSDEVARLGAALPALLRGFYYEGWHPRSRPAAQTSREAFFSRIREGVHRDPGVDAEAVSRAVFALLVGHVPGAEIEEIKAATPAPLHGLWPD